ncbi:MAG: CsoS2 family carboxysome shell protein [Acidiferrobacterales bacterium]
MNTSTAIMAEGGRDASRVRRAQLAQGKAALPPPSERRRTGERSASVIPVPNFASAAAPTVQAPAAVSAIPVPAAFTPAPAVSAPSRGVSGRDLSRVRRQAMAQGKTAVRQLMGFMPPVSAAPGAAPASSAVSGAVCATSGVSQAVPAAGSARTAAQAMRAAQARYGRGDQPAPRPSAHVRKASQLNYAPKVTTSETYAGGKVTGVRIGRGMNVTGDERGSSLQVTGSQYIGKETGFQPREGGIKVGASRTTGGLMVTGTQVRSKVSITGDEYGSGVRITGEADQALADDLLDRRESGAYASMQFQRQHNPHGHTVFGTNLGRSAKAVGSRERSRERALEFTDGGLPISGAAVGRSANVTGDESGSCRPITGDQYLMPAARQPLCETGNNANNAARAGRAFMRNGRGDPVTGAKVTESETWARQRITGVDVEHNDHVTGDEYGVCSSITGTPYVGPSQYDAACPGGAPAMAPPTAGNRVTGDTPRNVRQVTGTQRGGERHITGTPYFRADVDEGHEAEQLQRIENISGRFTVRSPQREGQLRAGAVEAPTAESRITGTFTAGEGKITGNQEFHFQPRPKGERSTDKSRITGEGRIEGPDITGGAWDSKPNVTGTEDYIAAERNPSERAGKPHAFASAGLFKGKGEHRTPTHHVTGMVGWSPKTAARVTLSGGAQG